ncbi:30S ribosomal protein S6 [Bdellovibrio bacteriovorus]|uniref:Small ribosomal subunit protein bS6 n=1 Tax=Bdellovibrio bacteriovorus TaxID=959 RepID=A0A150WD32_BDEBC|nr:30S ribosomal protein S6 [Bdellovibrio bacteriovorus]KYG60801.1 30S ribosomal protein S6 [Bdellovibrio bacteriovorus]
METTKSAKKPYEVVVLMHPDATLEEQKDLFKKNKATIESFKGSINSLETWGKRNLATPIGKTKKAIYFHSTFEADTQAIAELERTMRINDKVLRFMHTRLDERVSLAKFMEGFKKGLSESAAREKEREAKAAARKAAFAAAKAERFDKGE